MRERLELVDRLVEEYPWYVIRSYAAANRLGQDMRRRGMTGASLVHSSSERLILMPTPTLCPSTAQQASDLDVSCVAANTLNTQGRHRSHGIGRALATTQRKPRSDVDWMDSKVDTEALRKATRRKGLRLVKAGPNNWETDKPLTPGATTAIIADARGGTW